MNTEKPQLQNENEASPSNKLQEKHVKQEKDNSYLEDNSFIMDSIEKDDDLNVKYVQKQILEQLLMNSQNRLSNRNVDEISRVKREREDRAYWAAVFNEEQYLAHLYLQFRFPEHLKEEITDLACEREDRILSEIMNGSLQLEKKVDNCQFHYTISLQNWSINQNIKLGIKKHDLYSFEDSQILTKSPNKGKDLKDLSKTKEHILFPTQIEDNHRLDEKSKLNTSQNNILNQSQLLGTRNKTLSEHRQKQEEMSPQKIKEIQQFITKIQNEKQERMKRISKRRQKQEQFNQQQEFEELEKLKKIREEKREEFKKKLEKHNVQLKERQAQRRESSKQYQEFYKDYQNTKPLYTQMEEEFEEKEKLYQKVQEVVRLSQIKDQRKPIDKSALNSHAQNYERIREKNLEEIQQKRKATKSHISEIQNTSGIEEIQKQREIEYKNMIAKKRDVSKEKQYSNMVREMFAPKIDERKQLELNMQKEQINLKVGDKKQRQLKVIQQIQYTNNSEFDIKLNGSFEAQTHMSSVQLMKSVDLMESREMINFSAAKNGKKNNLQLSVLPAPISQNSTASKQRSSSTNTHTNRRLIQNIEFPKQQYSTQLPSNQQNNIFIHNQQNIQQLKGSSENNMRIKQKIKPMNGNFLMPLDNNKLNNQQRSFDTLDNMRGNSQLLIKEQNTSIEVDDNTKLTNKRSHPNGLTQISKKVDGQNPQQIKLTQQQLLQQQQQMQQIQQLRLQNKQEQSNPKSSNLIIHQNLQQSLTPEKSVDEIRQTSRYIPSHRTDKTNQENQLLMPPSQNQPKLEQVSNQRYENLNNSKLQLIQNQNIYNQDDQRVIDYLQEIEMKRLGHGYLEYSRKHINRKKNVPIESAQVSPIQSQGKQQLPYVALSNPVSPNIDKSAEKIKYPNYLVHSYQQKKQEQGGYLKDWQRDLNNSRLSKEDQLSKVIIKTKSIDKKAQLMESILRNNKSSYNNDQLFQQKSLLDEHYVQSIQAKIALLNKFSDNEQK